MKLFLSPGARSKKRFGFWSAILWITLGTAFAYIALKDRIKEHLFPNPGPSVNISWPLALEENEKPAENLIARNYYIIMDNSGSMGETECSENSTKEIVAKGALKAFVEKLEEDDNLGLLIFDQRGRSERVPLGIQNRKEFLNQVNDSKSGGRTPLGTAMKVGLEKLAKQAGKQLGYGDYNLVIITDGEATRDEHPNNVVKFVLKDTPIIIHTVGFCIGSRHSLNQPGKIIYKSANNPQELFKGLEEVLAESEAFVVDAFPG